mmetsp:Transcript_16007/g.30455  ORF Transcript_16007/g.30455 Transcript_16007/m.30455 type:complete len:874 (+) Transcript_16007:889-3510(+)
MVRRLKADVLSELPPKQRTVVPVTTTASEKEACTTAMKNLKDSRGSSIEEALEQQPEGFNKNNKSNGASFHSAIMQAYQATGMGKAQAVVDYLMDFLAGSDTQKILVSAHHEKVMDHIDAALCRKHPNTHMRIDGSVPAVARAQLVRQFQCNSRVRVGLLSMTAVGLGLTLTPASTVLFAELHWTLSVLAQAEDWAHRIETTASCIQIVYMVCRDEYLSLDPMLCCMLGKKIGTLGEIVDGKKERPYLHVATQEQTTEQPRSVQEEVSDFFATEQQVNRKARKTPVKGSIESFFKPRSSKEARSKTSATKTPLASKIAATPEPAEGATTTISWKYSVCAFNSSTICVPGQQIECVCANLHDSRSKASIPGETNQIVLRDDRGKAANPEIGFIEWDCETCTCLNKKACNSASFYHCEICSCSYSPEISPMRTPGQPSFPSSKTPQLRRISIGSEQRLLKKRRGVSPSESASAETSERRQQSTPSKLQIVEVVSTMKVFHIHIMLIGLLYFTGVVRGFSATHRRFPSMSLPYRTSQRYWSKQAFIEEKGKALVFEDSSVLKGGVLTDVSSPRLWLESQPDGVYTVMRSDLFISERQSPHERPWRLWGVDFHMNRLSKPFSKLYGSNNSALAAAIHKSTSIIGCLLAETFAEERKNMVSCEPGSTCVVTITLLWYPVDDSTVGVKGHVFTSGEMIKPRDYSSVTPIRAALALEGSMPNRKDNFPDCKQSSWCTTRRPLEEKYMADGASEVLLTDTKGDVPTILEGLTTNFFAVYSDGVLKTPDQGMLEGYARGRVKKAAKALGYRLEEGPIALDDAALWKEVFLTSAIRICQPVESITEEKDGKTIVHWREDPNEKVSDTPVWQKIYNQILSDKNL